MNPTRNTASKHEIEFPHQLHGFPLSLARSSLPLCSFLPNGQWPVPRRASRASLPVSAAPRLCPRRSSAEPARCAIPDTPGSWRWPGAKLRVREARLQPLEKDAAIGAGEPRLGFGVADRAVRYELHARHLIELRAGRQRIPELPRHGGNKRLWRCFRAGERPVAGADRKITALEIVRGPVSAGLDGFHQS